MAKEIEGEEAPKVEKAVKKVAGRETFDMVDKLTGKTETGVTERAFKILSTSPMPSNPALPRYFKIVGGKEVNTFFRKQKEL